MTCRLQNKKPNISFLIGSGFSVPAKIPCVSKINQRFANLQEDEIEIDFTQVSRFLTQNKKDPIPGFRNCEKMYIYRFIKFYLEEILSNQNDFHYEIFFDYYMKVMHQKNSITDSERIFYEDYKNSNNSCTNLHNDLRDAIYYFNISFNQLLAELLHKDEYIDNAYDPYASKEYNPYLELLEIIVTKYNVKIHSLNHDLLFEWLVRRSNSLWDKFTDGFTLAGSKIYGDLHCRFPGIKKDTISRNLYAKVKYFDNKYNKSLCLFKLHGSIDNYKLYLPNPSNKIFYIKKNINFDGYFYEARDKESEDLVFDPVINDIIPEFLSGVKYKITQYKEGAYYPALFKHFKSNLNNAKLLIVIGYGFGDQMINKYLEDNYLSRGKKMIIIDPFIPQSDLIAKYNPDVIQKSVIDISLSDIKNHLPFLS